jgi:hypothetical protein
MKKVISFSLYGDNPKYTYGAICNVEIAKIIYPEWICRFYCGNSVPINIIEKLSEYDNVEIFKMTEDGYFNYMTWRFLAYDDSDVEVMISRDTDSRLSFREKKLVDIFISSDFLFHDIRDHYLHGHIMGGMWGIKKGSIPSMLELLKSSSVGMSYGQDQDFMLMVVGPLLKNKILCHDSNYYNDNVFPIKKTDTLSNLCESVSPSHVHFIGEVFPGDNYNKPKNHIFY